MHKTIAIAIVSAALGFTTLPASAGGWGGGASSHSSGLINVSPNVRTGNVSVLNGTSLLNNSPIASGNVVSGILNGNGIANGLLGGNRIGVLGGNTHTKSYSVGRGKR